MSSSYDIGVDIGGTFTDLVAIDDHGERTVIKTPSTPADPSIGMVLALKQAAAALMLDFDDFLGRIARICHGTTVTTNAVITHSGCKVGMLTTKGVRDTIEVRRGIRELEFLYDYTYPQPVPLCPRNFRMTVGERVQADGEILHALKDDEVRSAVRAFREEGVEALAVCFLWSFRNPTHELRAAEICRELHPDAYLALSHQVAPILGEYLRFQTTVVDAYVGPIIRRYMTAMTDTLSTAGYKGALLIVTSNGGLMSPEAIMNRAAVTLTSGPASGPVAAIWYGEQYDARNLITMDMGGTSFDTSLVKQGKISVRHEQAVGGVYHIGLPSVDVHAVGIGGGTVAWLDEAGALRLGPKSMGADPGPACYGRGGIEATITDANLVLGRLNPDYFIGGAMRLDKGASIAALKRIADPKGMSVEAMARAVLTIAVVNMAEAIEVISVRRGENPRDYGLLVGGGAGPGHAGELARRLRIAQVIVPRESSIFCAVGGIISDLRHDYVASIEQAVEGLDWQRLIAALHELRSQADETLDAEQVKESDRYYQISADMKYVGQYHEIRVEWPWQEGFGYAERHADEIIQRFHDRHEALYAHHDLQERPFVSNIKLTAFGAIAPVKPKLFPSAAADAQAYKKGEREVWFEETGLKSTPIFDGDKMLAGVRLLGPCVVEQKTTTLVVPPAVALEVSGHGDFLMSVPV